MGVFPGSNRPRQEPRPKVVLPMAERRIVLHAARSRAMDLGISFEKEGYGPGDKVVAVLRAKKLSGSPIAGGSVSGSARVGGTEVWSGSTKTDSTGQAFIRFALPKALPQSDGSSSNEDVLNLRVVDDGDGGNGAVESTSRALPLVTRNVELFAYPEGGELVAGLPSRLYFEGRLPSGDPADVSIAVCAVGPLQPNSVASESGMMKQAERSFAETVSGVINSFRGENDQSSVSGAQIESPRGAGAPPVPEGCLVTARAMHEGRGVTPRFISPVGMQLKIRILEPESASKSLPLEMPR